MVRSDDTNGTHPIPTVGGGCIWVPGSLDPRAARSLIADCQGGRVAREQLRTVGLTASMIRHDLRTGMLHPDYPGVYAVGHRAAVEHGEEFAALLSVGWPAWLTGDSEMFLWELAPRAPREVHVVVPHERRRRALPGFVVHGTRALDPRDFTSRHGLPVTTPERVLLDLADDGNHDAYTVECAFDEALHRRLISPTKIRELAARHPTRRGAKVLLALADPDRAKGPTKSELERRALRILRAANVPDPERQYPIEVFTMDAYWPQARYGLEFDSWRWHAGPWAFKRDRRKSARLKDLGIELDRVTDEMLKDPLPFIARVVRTLTERTRNVAA